MEQLTGFTNRGAVLKQYRLTSYILTWRGFDLNSFLLSFRSKSSISSKFIIEILTITRS